MPPRPLSLRRAASTLAPLTGKARSQAPGRIYSERKAYLFDYYSHLLSRSQMVLLFKHANLTVAESGALRREITKLPLPASATESATLTIARTGILAPAVLKTDAASLADQLGGQTALITCPTLSPKYIKSMLAIIEKTMKSAQKDEVKGKEVKQPSFSLFAGVVEGRVVQPEGVTEMAKLPEIEQLRAQLVGLLEMPQRQLVGVLSQAGGGGLVRTLQGLEESLKEKEGGEAPAPPA